MADKHEWRKREKGLYLPKNKPEVIEVPELKFITIRGEGNPNNADFGDRIGALYPLAYTIKMLPKKMDVKPKGYFDFTVYPLEGIWDITDEAKKNFTGVINKDDLVYQIMLRQPDFVDEAFFCEMLAVAKEKKGLPLLDEVQFETFTEGKCIQMMHHGPFDDEPASFEKMEAFAESEGLTRVSKIHREIYITDARKTPPERQKTVLRFQAV